MEISIGQLKRVYKQHLEQYLKPKSGKIELNLLPISWQITIKKYLRNCKRWKKRNRRARMKSERIL